LLPAQLVVMQKIVIRYQGAEYIAWRHMKGSCGVNSEVDGRALKLVCELRRKPDFEGTHYGICKAE